MIWGCLYFPRRKLIHPPVAPPGAACDEESPSQEAAWACQPRARSPQACVSTLAPIPLGVGARTRPKRRALQRSCSYTPRLLRQVPRATRSRPREEAAWACQPRARSPRVCVSTLAPIP